jgi:hypothetical protein
MTVVNAVRHVDVPVPPLFAILILTQFDSSERSATVKKP